MNLEPECVGCLFNQMLKAFKLLKPDISQLKIMQAQKKLMEHLVNSDFENIPAPLVGKVLYQIVGEILETNDPYYELKAEYNQLALKHYEKVKSMVFKAKDPVFQALIVSALGNTIDFASQHKIDIITDLKQFSVEDLRINDYSQFKNDIKNASNLLILGDNCGEIVFDKLLIETLQQFYPNLKITYSVRAKPIINDVTMSDAKMVGLDKIVLVVRGSSAPGTDLNDISEEFRKAFYSDDGFILSKGQGNFETLYQTKLPDKPLYYLLKAKCSLMERIFKVPIGSLIFKKRTEKL